MDDVVVSIKNCTKTDVKEYRTVLDEFSELTYEVKRQWAITCFRYTVDIHGFTDSQAKKFMHLLIDSRS